MQKIQDILNNDLNILFKSIDVFISLVSYMR